MSEANSSIAGRVLDSAGRPLAGVTVSITKSPRAHSDLAALTGADGTFRFTALPPGSYELAAFGGGRAAGAVDVAADSVASIDLRVGGP